MVKKENLLESGVFEEVVLDEKREGVLDKVARFEGGDRVGEFGASGYERIAGIIFVGLVA